MSEQAISQAEIDAVFPKVAQIVADALGSTASDSTISLRNASPVGAHVRPASVLL